ncbi:MAG: lysophospholipase [Acetobacteraceae bacterium]|nr:lysophospholipase [Acetobacteraceae bacterium]
MLLRIALMVALLGATSAAQAQKWVTSWAGSVQGPYPTGNAVAQPDLSFAFRDGQSGAKDQTFRLIIRPSLWGSKIRLRFSNAFGAKPVTFDGVFVAMQLSGAALVPGGNRPVTFGLKRAVTVQPGGQAWSDAVTLPWVANPGAPELLGRKLAVSFHVAGETGPMTWHAKAMQTSYITPPGAGSLGELEDESAFPNSTTSWFFLDALDVQAPPETGLVVCLGDSITDGTNSTLNGDDRWPDMLARRFHAAGIPVAVVNAGIGGNMIVGPADYTPAKPFAGGPSALSRLDRDVLGLSGVTDVIWFEGINDFSTNGNASVDQVRDGLAAGVKRIRAKFPGVKVFGATLTGIAGTTSEAQAPPAVDEKRKAFNAWLRDSSKLFDGVIEFDKAVADPQTGGLRPEFKPSSTVGGPGDGLHPNRAGYLAMGDAVDLRQMRAPVPKPKPKPPAPKPSANPDSQDNPE